MIEYDPHRWRDHFLDVKGSMVGPIVYRSLICTAVATGFTLAHFHWRTVEGNPQVHVLVGAALSLLLVFRTNASYDRFWEARKLWGTMVNTCRNLARSASILLAGEEARLSEVLRWTVAFPYVTMHQLRGLRGLGPVERELPAGEVAAVRDAQHPPLACAVRLTRCLYEARRAGVIGTRQYLSLDNDVQILIDVVGACERILRTPLPFAYVVHLRRALLLYCCTLPWALLRMHGWAAVPITFLVSFVLFGIEEIGVEIEEPFGTDDNDLPLEAICANIERNLRALLPPVSGGEGA